MLRHLDDKTKLWVGAGISLVTLLVGLAGGLGIASALLDSGKESTNTEVLKKDLSDARVKLTQTESEVQRLESALAEKEAASQRLSGELEQAGEREDALRTQLAQAETRASSALEELAQKKAELERLASAQTEIATLERQAKDLRAALDEEKQQLESIRDLTIALDKHRSLLVELRKDLPETREDAFSYWNKVKSLASKAEPSLVSPADKVILRIDTYFNWVERQPSPTSELNRYFDWLVDYTQSGAVAYENAVDSFLKDTLLVVITQIDAVVGQLE